MLLPCWKRLYDVLLIMYAVIKIKKQKSSWIRVSYIKPQILKRTGKSMYKQPHSKDSEPIPRF